MDSRWWRGYNSADDNYKKQQSTNERRQRRRTTTAGERRGVVVEAKAEEPLLYDGVGFMVRKVMEAGAGRAGWWDDC